MLRLLVLCGLTVMLSGVPAAPADVRVRVATWNVTNYSGGRVAWFQTALFGEYQGRSLSPDVIICQEMLSDFGVTNFLDMLNTAPGSPGDWTAADFVDGPDTDNALFYRTTLGQLATDLSPNGVTVVATGGVSPNHPRNITRYDLRFAAGTPAETTLAIYSSHMKSGTSSSDKDRRLLEAQRIRDDAEALPAGWHFLLGGDFNIQSSGQTAYVELVGAQLNNDGRFFDPILTPGSWNNNSAFRIVHTQDPVSAMDDRHDQLLLSAGLIDGVGADYIGDPSLPYSITTWDDPHHSYRCWGNDGTSYNGPLTISGNQMVGSDIAQALVYSAQGGGHLPVYLDLRIPPCFGDAECDGYSDSADWQTFAACLTGPWAATGFDPPAPYCAGHSDSDDDEDVDVTDLAVFQRGFTGAQP